MTIDPSPSGLDDGCHTASGKPDRAFRPFAVFYPQNRPDTPLDGLYARAKSLRMEWVELEWADTGDLGPDRPDYFAWHGDKKIARVYLDKAGRGYVLWRWFLWWYAVPNSGHAVSRREAFPEVERNTGPIARILSR